MGPQIPDTEDTLPLPACSEEECPQKKSMNKCLMLNPRITHTSSNGSPITLNLLFAIFLLKDLRWLLLSLVTLLLSKKCSRESLNNLLSCLEERLSYIGILEKVWTKWSSPKPNQIFPISSLNIKTIKMPLLMMKEKWKEKKEKWTCKTKRNKIKVILKVFIKINIKYV